MRIPLFYFALYLGTGVTLPWLPPWLRSLGLSGKELSVAISVQALLMILLPPVWGFLADRTRKPVQLLRLACVGAALGFSPMLFAGGFWTVAATLALFGLFGSATSSLTDSVALHEARLLGTEYSRLRVWGSLGFIAASYGFGLYLEAGGAISHVPAAALLAMGTYALASFVLRPYAGEEIAPPSLRDARSLLQNPALTLHLVAAAVHYGALAPYHMLYSVHLRDLGASDASAGAGFAVAVTAEVIVMWRFRSLARRLSPVPLLAACYGVAIVRWVATASFTDGTVLAALQAMHGLVYGAWLVASMLWLEDVVPPALRATGRALFGSFAFGLGGVFGNLLAGTLYDIGGGRLAFAAAAVLELLPLALLIPLRRYQAQQPA